MGDKCKGYLARDTSKAGGEIRFFIQKPKMDKKSGIWLGRDTYGDSELLEQPIFRMTLESFEDSYDLKTPSVGKCIEAELEL
jgi:hypothetical protein